MRKLAMSLLLWRNDKRHFLGVYLSSYERVGGRFCQLIKLVCEIVKFESL
jgi:hypothetical protein